MSILESAPTEGLQELTAQVAAAYFAANHVPAGEIAGVISQIAASLGRVGQPSAPQSEPVELAPPPPRATPVQIRRSITPDALISFEDGRAYRTLKRHLRARGLSPDAYRAKWGLPPDYPMAAPSYSEARSRVAKQIGLGRRGVEARRASAEARRVGGRRG